MRRRLPGFTLDQPWSSQGPRSPALAVRFGIAGVAVASAVVGWVLFGDTDPALWEVGDGGYWPVRELMPAAVAFSIGGAVLLGYRKARWPAGVLLICGLLAGIALLFAGLWWDRMLKHGASSVHRGSFRPSVPRKRHRDRPFHGALVDGIASALPRRTTAWKALEGSARHFDWTGRDRCAEECVRLPDHRRSSRVVLLVDCSRRRLADRSRVAVCSLAPWQSSAAEADRRVRHCDGDHDRRQLPLCLTVRTIPLPASRL